VFNTILCRGTYGNYLPTTRTSKYGLS
jgi:hypothetical protein